MDQKAGDVLTIDESAACPAIQKPTIYDRVPEGKIHSSEHRPALAFPESGHITTGSKKRALANPIQQEIANGGTTRR